MTQELALFVAWRTAMMTIASCNYFHQGCYMQITASHQEYAASGYYVEYRTKAVSLASIEPEHVCGICWQRFQDLIGD